MRAWLATSFFRGRQDDQSLGAHMGVGTPDLTGRNLHVQICYSQGVERVSRRD